LSVGKRVRKLAEVFYGRVGAYAPALTAGEAELAEVLRRNVYPEGVAPAALKGLLRHVIATRDALTKIEPQRIAGGDFVVPEA
ncbi:MAG: ubiquinol-cytochrome C chaperone, partial [Rhizobiales bacterium]|nr:ubiquinol-cytochrome C chaperone [Hyphomicrobiales bacterium]